MHQFLNVYWVEEGGALNHYGLYPLFHKTIEPARVRRVTFALLTSLRLSMVPSA